MGNDKVERHQRLAKQLKFEIQKEFQRGRIFERHVGVFYTRSGHPVRINSPGMSDLWALIDGVHFEIEVKTGSGVLSKPQKAWKNACSIMGAVFVEAREINQTIEEIKKALGGQSLERK